MRHITTRLDLQKPPRPFFSAWNAKSLWWLKLFYCLVHFKGNERDNMSTIRVLRNLELSMPSRPILVSLCKSPGRPHRHRNRRSRLLCCNRCPRRTPAWEHTRLYRRFPQPAGDPQRSHVLLRLFHKSEPTPRRLTLRSAAIQYRS